MNAADYLSQAFRLLAPGRAFTHSPTSNLGRLLQAKADGAARFDARCADLLKEADPRTANELIDAWETEAGLPDGCTGALTDLGQRQAALWQKVTGTGGQSRPYFTEVAHRLGYEVTIIEFRPANCESLCDATLFEEDWRFVWEVVVPADSAPVLECVLNRLKPAETDLFFTYTGD